MVLGTSATVKTGRRGAAKSMLDARVKLADTLVDVEIVFFSFFFSVSTFSFFSVSIFSVSRIEIDFNPPEKFQLDFKNQFQH